jgi:hypothetical protein
VIASDSIEQLRLLRTAGVSGLSSLTMATEPHNAAVTADVKAAVVEAATCSNHSSAYEGLAIGSRKSR